MTASVLAEDPAAALVCLGIVFAVCFIREVIHALIRYFGSSSNQ